MKETNTIQQIGDNLKQVNESIEEQKAYLSQLEISDKKSAAFNEKTNELKELVQIERGNFKNTIFNSQIMKFETNSSPINENILGSLKFETDQFTVTKTLNLFLASLNIKFKSETF